MIIEKPGIYELSHDEYHADPVVVPSLSRSTILDLIFKSPFHAWFSHPHLNPNFIPEESNGKFDLGSAAHSLLLEGIDNAAVIEAEDWRTKDAKAAREEARKEGKFPLLKKQYGEVREMVLAATDAILDCSELLIKNLETEGDPEQSFIWEEEGAWFRVRPDWIRADDSLILDYKTTQGSANPADLDRHIVSMGYDVQAALYVRGVKAVTGKSPKFIFVWQECQPPYLCSFNALSPAFLEMARQKVDYGIFLWRECMKKNEWPGYPNRVAFQEPPVWALNAWEEKAQGIGL